MTVEQRIRQFIERELHWQGTPDELKEDTSLIESGALDSLGIVKTTSFLESEFGIKIDDDDVVPRHFESIRALSDLVELKSTP
jgi:acyl carrier protein